MRKKPKEKPKKKKRKTRNDKKWQRQKLATAF